jgi:hypothetical protein
MMEACIPDFPSGRCFIKFKRSLSLCRDQYEHTGARRATHNRGLNFKAKCIYFALSIDNAPALGFIRGRLEVNNMFAIKSNKVMRGAQIQSRLTRHCWLVQGVAGGPP